MTPARRITDGEAGMERAFTLLRDDMHVGFDQVNKRLDAMNNKVADHGEAIAGLKQGCHANSVNTNDLREIAETLAAHRARCPYDRGGDVTATAQWTNAQLAGGVASGSVAGLVVLEFIKWWLTQR